MSYDLNRVGEYFKNASKYADRANEMQAKADECNNKIIHDTAQLEKARKVLQECENIRTLYSRYEDSLGEYAYDLGSSMGEGEAFQRPMLNMLSSNTQRIERAISNAQDRIEQLERSVTSLQQTHDNYARSAADARSMATHYYDLAYGARN